MKLSWNKQLICHSQSTAKNCDCKNKFQKINRKQKVDLNVKLLPRSQVIWVYRWSARLTCAPPGNLFRSPTTNAACSLGDPNVIGRHPGGGKFFPPGRCCAAVAASECNMSRQKYAEGPADFEKNIHNEETRDVHILATTNQRKAHVTPMGNLVFSELDVI